MDSNTNKYLIENDETTAEKKKPSKTGVLPPKKRIDIHIDEQKKNELKMAAILAGETLTEFMIGAARLRANLEVLARNSSQIIIKDTKQGGDQVIPFYRLIKP